jgi:hypothetical protein
MAGLAVLAGCAGAEPHGAAETSVSRPLSQQQPDWAADLSVLLPAVEACLQDSAVVAVGVTKAWPIAEGLTGVRLLTQGGERIDCVAVADGSGIVLTEKVWTVSQLAGERAPLFTPASAQRPSESQCLSVSVARDGIGQVVGWLSYDVCRQPRAALPSAAVEPGSPKRRTGGNG